MAAAKASTDIAVQFGLLSPDQLGRLQWVEFDLEDPQAMPAALGNASRVSGQGSGFKVYWMQVLRVTRFKVSRVQGVQGARFKVCMVQG